MDGRKSGTTTQKICKVTKHDTRIKIYKAQQNLRWSVSKCQNFGSFLQTVALKSQSDDEQGTNKLQPYASFLLLFLFFHFFCSLLSSYMLLLFLLLTYWFFLFILFIYLFIITIIIFLVLYFVYIALLLLPTD